MNRSKLHDFHIPVMGLAYTVDSPVRIAHYGINSVVSIIDDELLESMTAYYSSKFQFPYHAITKKMQDYRAQRISTYLNLIDKIVKKKFDDFKKELLVNRSSLDDLLKILSPKSEIVKKIRAYLNQEKTLSKDLKNILDHYLFPGKIDVNIMTKVDRENYVGNKKLAVEYNDAHASLRGFAQSNLDSSVVFSAGMNPRLYNYLTSFNDFFPDKKGYLKKKIIIKVSDYRSAFIQGQFLAKKGLWVSEYRIESGLNCGGHAFASEGSLLGPVLEEFKERKDELLNGTYESLCLALKREGWPVPDSPLDMKISVQGGVGTSEEHRFLTDHYQVDSVGWGTPFLLVPEATLVDSKTRNLLMGAGEKELYLSNISPLGVPFNTVKNTTNEYIKQQRIARKKPGSSCPKKHLALNYEFSVKGQCTASRKYQDLKLKELESEGLNTHENIKAVTEKSCLCVGLANSAYIDHKISVKQEAQGVVICPGPNMAYFNTEISLIDMIGHIYGRNDVLKDEIRPNMFIKELQLNIAYFETAIKQFKTGSSSLTPKKLELFKSNLLSGITYYKKLFQQKFSLSEKQKADLFNELSNMEHKIGGVLLDS